ncbi:hypothetical protein [Clostridium sp.]|nr:hypothetical protein [Clostridium sp.]MDR3593734.1 hypothetical protein [Clostridium sp.]
MTLNAADGINNVSFKSTHYAENVEDVQKVSANISKTSDFLTSEFINKI